VSPTVASIQFSLAAESLSYRRDSIEATDRRQL
jgi:hypothetical protein